MAESKTETSRWTGEATMTHGRKQEAAMEKTHEIPGTHTCLRAIDKTIATIQAKDIEKDTIPESIGRNNKIYKFDLSHLAMRVDKNAKT